jgi:hypothetical protein
VRLLFALVLLVSISAEAQLAIRNNLHQETAVPYQVTVQYSATSDLLDPVKPRRYEHDLAINSIYNWSDRFRLGVLADLTYFSLENQIVETQRGYGNLQPSFSFFSTYLLKTPFLTSQNIGFSYYLPLDEYSRLEGYNGVASLGTTMVKRLFYNFSFIQGFRGTYVLNSFDKNAAGIPNREYSVSASPMLSWTITSEISVLLGFGARWGKFVDGNSDYSYNNSQTLNYSRKNISVYISHVNGGYTENGDIYLWFIDKNRNFVTAGVSYDF